MKTLLLAAAVAAAPAAAHADKKKEARAAEPVAVSEAEALAKVVKVEAKTRVVTIKGQDGRELRVSIPADVQNISKIKPGSRLNIRYVPALAVAIDQPGRAAPSAEPEKVRLAPEGGAPAEIVVDATRVSAKVRDIDRNSRAITIECPGEAPVTLQVPESAAGFSKLKVGDDAVIQRTEAVALTAIRQAAR